jgi:hypothetical protein
MKRFMAVAAAALAVAAIGFTGADTVSAEAECSGLGAVVAALGLLTHARWIALRATPRKARQ